MSRLERTFVVFPCILVVFIPCSCASSESFPYQLGIAMDEFRDFDIWVVP